MALHTDPGHKQVVNWATRWVSIIIMAVLTVALWRRLAAHDRGISVTAAVITMFMVFALRRAVEPAS